MRCLLKLDENEAQIEVEEGQLWKPHKKWTK